MCTHICVKNAEILPVYVSRRYREIRFFARQLIAGCTNVTIVSHSVYFIWFLLVFHVLFWGSIYSFLWINPFFCSFCKFIFYCFLCYFWSHFGQHICLILGYKATISCLHDLIYRFAHIHLLSISAISSVLFVYLFSWFVHKICWVVLEISVSIYIIVSWYSVFLTVNIRMWFFFSSIILFMDICTTYYCCVFCFCLGY